MKRIHTTFLTTGIFTLALCFSGMLSAQFVEEKRIEDEEKHFENQMMKVTVVDENSNPIAVNITVEGINGKKPTLLEDVSDTTFEVKSYRRYTLTCVKEGYMFYSKKFWPEQKAQHNEVIQLQKLQEGQKTIVPGIAFQGDKTEIYYKSKSSLDELITFMKLNPNVRVAVVGHVNAPDPTRSDRFYVKASTERSLAVLSYLIENGVAPERLEAKGLGNREMIYPDPTADWQNDANRRIEIEILDI